LKRRQYNVLFNVTYSSSVDQTSAPKINIQSTTEKGFNAVLFGSNGNSYSLYAVSYVYRYVDTSQHRDAGRDKEIKGNWERNE
jgi:hypothetical protein